MTNSRLTDPEVLEWRYPVLLESHRINRGSGGKGRHQGGDGTIRRVRFLEPMQAALVSNHRKVPPFGLARRRARASRATSGSSARTARSRAAGRAMPGGGGRRRRVRRADAERWRFRAALVRLTVQRADEGG